jgi:hypothetical protein
VNTAPAGPVASIDDAIARLQGTNADAARDAAEWLAKQPLDATRQAEVSKALNGLDREGLRDAALAVLPIWGTSENASLLGQVLIGQKFDRQPCLKLAQKLADDRLLEPLVVVLTDTFDDGKLAEEILATWGEEADAVLVKHMNHAHDEAHNRITRLLEQRKIEPKLLAGQAVADLSSQAAETRGYAAAWLEESKCAAVDKDQHAAATDAALKLLTDRSPSVRHAAVEIIGHCGEKSHDSQFVALLTSKKAEEWQAGLLGVIRTGNVSGAKDLAERMSDEAFGGAVTRRLISAGEHGEDLALAILKQPLEGPGRAHLFALLAIEEIGGKKSLAALTAFDRKHGRGPKGMPASVANAVDVARKNVMARTKSR